MEKRNYENHGICGKEKQGYSGWRNDENLTLVLSDISGT
jgi:hypothetical protein